MGLCCQSTGCCKGTILRFTYDACMQLLMMHHDFSCSWPACKLWHCSSSTNEKLNMWRMHIWLILKSCCLVKTPLQPMNWLSVSCVSLSLRMQSLLLWQTGFVWHRIGWLSGKVWKSMLVVARGVVKATGQSAASLPINKVNRFTVTDFRF